MINLGYALQRNWTKQLSGFLSLHNELHDGGIQAISYHRMLDLPMHIFQPWLNTSLGKGMQIEANFNTVNPKIFNFNWKTKWKKKRRNQTFVTVRIKRGTYWVSSAAAKYSSLNFFIGKLATTTGSTPCNPLSSCNITKQQRSHSQSVTNTPQKIKRRATNNLSIENKAKKISNHTPNEQEQATQNHKEKTDNTFTYGFAKFKWKTSKKIPFLEWMTNHYK